jgi:hypothetical protein
MQLDIKIDLLARQSYCEGLLETVSGLWAKRVEHSGWQYIDTGGATALSIHELLEVTVFKDSATHKTGMVEYGRWCAGRSTYKTIGAVKNINTHTGKGTVEEYEGGKYEYHEEYVERSFTHRDSRVWYSKFGSFELLYYYNRGATGTYVLHAVLVVVNKRVEHLLTFDETDCYEHLPLSRETNNTVSWRFMSEMLAMLASVGGLYMYFQSMLVALAIFGGAFSLLAMTEHYNPQQKSVIRVFQIVVYAIIIFFIR